MAITKVGIHYITHDIKRTIASIKRAEKLTMEDTTDEAVRLFLTNNFPKSDVVVKNNVVSVFPFCPDFGQSNYLGWFKFNTRKNSYTQKWGSIVALEDKDLGWRIELWKTGALLNRLEVKKLDESISSFEVNQFIANLKKILVDVGRGNFSNNENSQYIYPGNFLSYLESQIGFQIFLNPNEKYKLELIDETPYTKFYNEIALR